MNKQQLDVLGKMINTLDSVQRDYLNTLITTQRETATADTDLQSLADRFVSWAKSTGRCKGGFIKSPRHNLQIWAFNEFTGDSHHSMRVILREHGASIINLCSVDGVGVKVYRIAGVPCRAVRVS